MSKISIAMTTYNGERFLTEQLQSLASQTRPPDEVIICDDVSLDHTVALIREFIEAYGLQNWRLYENAVNFGYAHNFKHAMSLTTGDIVFLCDQDDVWDVQKIEKMAAIMEQNSEIAALASDYLLIDGDGCALMEQGKKFYVPDPQADVLSCVRYGPVLYYNIAQGCACAYRRHLVDAFCQTEDCGVLPHDWALNLMAHQAEGLYYLQEELLHYRLHGSNAIGIGNADAAITNRIPRLEQYAAETAAASKLSIPESAQKELCSISEFTQTRINWLRYKRTSIWICGFFRYLSILKKYFFWQYMKDFALVLRGKIPASQP